jgi:hypothetical protein
LIRRTSDIAQDFWMPSNAPKAKELQDMQQASRIVAAGIAAAQQTRQDAAACEIPILGI